MSYVPVRLGNMENKPGALLVESLFPKKIAHNYQGSESVPFVR